MSTISEEALAEFMKCITFVHEPDDEKVLAGLRYILSLPDRPAADDAPPGRTQKKQG